MTIQDLYTLYVQSGSVSTDTRSIQKNSLFFALRGDTFDGNKFAKNAIEKGASYAIINDPKYNLDERYILVDDPLKTLQELAKYHRLQLAIPIIGITGSNGKTTTKELIKNVLKQKFNTFATYGNLNNHIGVPLSLLSMTQDHEIAIIEMGANHQNEIEFLSNICLPDCGLITNIGKAHLEGFGGIEGVEKGKTELFQHLSERKKQIFINLEDKRLANYVEAISPITYGTSNCDYQGSITSTSPFLCLDVRYKEQKISLNSNLIGTYNFNNILAAVTLGDYFQVDPEKIKKGIEEYIPTNNRSQLIHQNTNTIILDAYNANPSSMKEAIINLIKTDSNSKFFILGDMLELGDESKEEHKLIINQLVNNDLKGILVGKEFSNIEQTHFMTFETNEQAKIYLQSNPKDNTLFLIKGSRGIKLETIQEVL